MGSQTDTRKIHWIDWEKLYWPKSAGGMGFRDHTFNLAVLIKQGWRLLCHLDTLVAMILRAKYYPNEKFMEASAGHNSYIYMEEYYAGEGDP